MKPQSILIWIFLIPKDAEHFQIYFLSIFISSFQNSMFRSTAHFNNKNLLLVHFVCPYTSLVRFMYHESHFTDELNQGKLNDMLKILQLVNSATS